MIGAIAGDIMGSVYEFRPIKTKDFPLFSPFCDFTDDTDIRSSYSFDESCQRTAPDAIIAFLDSTSYEDAIRNAVS
jgi:ADP-ribosylglycohydrolase